MSSKLPSRELTINSINIAPEVNTVTVSVRMCDRSHVQLEKSTPRISIFYKIPKGQIIIKDKLNRVIIEPSNTFKQF